jgi:tRNA (guanine37-N1)-methyltransferase
MLVEPLVDCLEAQGVREKGEDVSCDASANTARRVVYLSASGRRFTEAVAREYAALEELVLVCGRYEGIDQRVIDGWIDDEVCVGDYVLSSGEVAALTVIDAVYRLIDGVITGESLDEESFNKRLLEYPQWTRPESFRGRVVPEVLLSGHHANIKKWRFEEAVKKTLKNRPELLELGINEGCFDKETLEIIEKLRETDAQASVFQADRGGYERDSGHTGRSNEGKLDAV